MKPDMWARVSEAFLEASAAGPEDRDRMLAELADADPEVHEHVVRLLRADAHTLEWLTGGGERVALPTPDSRVGAQVGPFVLDAFLAEGGMGSVYRAHRAGAPFEQTVAVKLLRRGLFGPEVMRRFDAERRIVARLDHPGIARLLDGGTLPDGQPWFAMELVEGRSIVRYAEEEDLPLRARLELLIQVCRAVDYAHDRLVVHRDLKAGNILVTPDGTPKLLDFGIAKRLEDEEGTGEQITRTAGSPHTPASAAPEQVAGLPATTATDTYALGVLLYELITGLRPYPEQASGEELRRHIQTTIPTAPSRVWSDVDSGEDPVPWGRALRGDMDVICLKALRKEPERRYASAAALADDLQAFLDRRPVSARPDSVGYRVGRFVARNRAAVAVASLAGVLLLGSSFVYATNLREERDRARLGEQRASEALAFLTEVFRASDPSAARSDTLPVGVFLDRGVERVRSDEVTEPTVRAALGYVLGDVIYNLGRVAQADTLVESAIELRRAALAPDEAVADLELAAMERLLGRIRIMTGDFDASTTYLDRAASRQAAASPEPDREFGLTLRALSDALERRGDLDSALATARRAADVLREDPGPESAEYATGVGAVARMLDLRGEFNEARPMYQASREALRASEGETSTAFLDATFNLSDMERRAGNREEAERLFRDLLAVEIRIYGREHHLVATDMNTLGSLLSDMGRYDEAEELIREGLEIRRRVLGPEHYQVATSHNTLGRVAAARGDLAAADREYRRALAISRVALGEDHRNRAINLLNLGFVAARQERWSEALDLLGRAEAMIARVQDGRTQDWGHVQFGLAQVYDLMGRDGDALAVYEELLPFRARTLAPDADLLRRTIHGHAVALSGVGRADEAIPILADLSEAIHAGGGRRAVQVDADLALARTRRAADAGPALPADEAARLRQALVARVEEARDELGPEDAGTRLAESRLAEFERLTSEG